MKPVVELPPDNSGSCGDGQPPALLGLRHPRSAPVCFILSLVLALGTTLLAQQPDRAGVSASGRGASQKINFEAALAWLANGNFTAAEAALFKDNFRGAGTVGYDVECATRLTHMALILRGRLDYQTANLVSARALALLAETSRKLSTATPKGRAEVYEIIGFIHERLQADPTSAKSAYRQAQRELPSSPAAQAGLDRIKEGEEKLARLPGGRG